MLTRFDRLYEALPADEKKAFDAIWIQLHDTDDLKSVEPPHGYVLGGQPGAGKSRLQLVSSQECADNLVIANGDAYRNYHPKFAEIQEQYKDDSPKYTAEFSGKMTQLVIAKALDNRYNLLVEGTFRTSETPLKTLNEMQEDGYTTHVLVKTCPKETSWANTIKRYEGMLAAGEVPRHTDKKHHDLVTEVLAENCDSVYKNGKAADFRVYNYDGLIFDSRIDSGKCLPGDSVYVELNSLAGFKNSQQEYEKLKENLSLGIQAGLDKIESAISLKPIPVAERIAARQKFWNSRIEKLNSTLEADLDNKSKFDGPRL